MSASVAGEIAATAARLVVDEGMEYAQAKRKAVRQLAGRLPRGRTELPSNEQVEDEVRSHLALFCADTQPAELRALRELPPHGCRRCTSTCTATTPRPRRSPSSTRASTTTCPGAMATRRCTT